MAKKPKVPCRHPGCAELIPPGELYCEKHKAQHSGEGRGGAAARGYGSNWNRARRVFLEAHPLCSECMKQGLYVKATDVDHIIPHRGDPKLFWDQSNWQALCHSCHSKKTNESDHDPVYEF